MSGRPETPQGDQRRLKAMQGVTKCYIHVALFGINRTHDRPAETFVYVAFHSMRIMYANLVTVYANFAQEAH